MPQLVHRRESPPKARDRELSYRHFKVEHPRSSAKESPLCLMGVRGLTNG